MRILGLSGSLNTALEPWIPGLPRGFFHDAAAALIEDGVVVAAIEEERLNRIKHTHAFPELAIERCLAERGLSVSDVDEVAFFFEEDFLDAGLASYRLQQPDLDEVGARARIATLLGQEELAASITFVPHHLAHAASVVHHAAAEKGLVLVMDGSGEYESLTVFSFDGKEYESLAASLESASLGQLYFHGTRFLGFQLFDEYKVMGLAAYGDERKYHNLFRERYELLPGGEYRFDYRDFDTAILAAGIQPRRRNEPMRAEHRNFAAALQEALETIVIHVLDAAVERTGLRRLYLSGGVAQNCALNGRLAASGRFDAVYVDPVPHDAGAALGAATYRAGRHGDLAARRRTTIDLGSHIGGHTAIRATLDEWCGYVDYSQPADIVASTAQLLADGAIVGWVTGRAEFGSRALGQRSILADPRPAINRARVNASIKRREDFRPLAPAVLADRADEFFELPAAEIGAEFMSFSVPVLPDRRSDLAAVTHVDGTARLQLVRPEHGPFYELIRAFGELTGIPVVLNTSFNNEAEPIVESVADAVRCLLTTDLDLMVIGPFLVRRSARELDVSSLAPILVDSSALSVRRRANKTVWEIYEHVHPHDWRRHSCISAATGELLARADGRSPVAALTKYRDRDAVAAELLSLWRRRLVDFRPYAT